MSQSKRTERSKRPPRKSSIRKRPDMDEATRMAKALSHPLRHRILTELNNGVASPNELAQRLGERLGNVSYHVRALLDLDCIELVDTAQRRGALEHYYRATERALLTDEAWAQLPPQARRGFAAEWFKKTFSDVTEAIDGGGFDSRDDNHLSFTPLVLDEEAWKQLAGRLEEVLEEAFELQAEAAGRRVEGSQDEVRARLVLVQYEGAEPKKTRQRK